MTNGHVKAAKRDHANTFLRRGVIIMAIRLYGVGMTFLVTILLTRGLERTAMVPMPSYLQSSHWRPCPLSSVCPT